MEQAVELSLAILNVFQAIALAWIGLKQVQVKTELRRENGVVHDEIAAVHQTLRDNTS